MNFQGVMPALITPVKADGSLNEKELCRLIEHHLSQGADGFYIGGATGEGLIISKETHKALTKLAIEAVAHRVPCIVHVARMNYEEMLELARYAEQVGADAISAIPPLFYRYNDDGIYDYYKGLAKSVSIPVVIYNNPSTGVAFSIDLLRRLFSIPGVNAIKWTTYDFSTVMQLRAEFPDADIINGPDEMMLMGLSAGCNACIGTTYNFALPLYRRIYDLYRDGKIEEARRVQMQTCRIINVLARYNVIAVTKLITSRQGFDVNHPIYPSQKYGPEAEDRIMQELVAAGLKI